VVTDGDAQPDPEAEYQDQVLDGLDAWFGRFSWSKDAVGWTFRGPCPRCGHEIDKAFREDGIFALVPTRKEATPADTEGAEQDVMQCNCMHPHKGGAPGQGCGAWWGLEISRG
jgi:hypothetical protein